MLSLCSSQHATAQLATTHTSAHDLCSMNCVHCSLRSLRLAPRSSASAQFTLFVQQLLTRLLVCPGGVSRRCVQRVCPGDVPHTLEWLFFPCNNSQRLSLPTACHGSSLQSPLLAVPTPCSPHSLQSPLLAVPTPCSPHSLQPPLLTVPTPCSLLHVVYTAGATWSGPYCLL